LIKAEKKKKKIKAEWSSPRLISQQSHDQNEGILCYKGFEGEKASSAQQSQTADTK
jgi:hypothetical protein